MTYVDRLLQNWRIRVAGRYLKAGCRVLDIGCADGALFRMRSDLHPGSLGVDPDLPAPVTVNGYSCLPAVFPSGVLCGREFDAACLLAVLEHVPAADADRFARALWGALAPDGLVVVTVPEAVVDVILHVLRSVRLIHGMALEEHHGFRAADTLRVLHPPEFKLVIHKTFQCGLNNLFVFRKCTVGVEGDVK
jgi:hypothetical protein